jgi:hypothetical protein
LTCVSTKRSASATPEAASPEGEHKLAGAI